MDRSCPKCKKNISPFKRVKTIRKDSLERKAGELLLIHLCPFCNESITLNKDFAEYLIAQLVFLIPGFLFFVSFQSNVVLGMKISVLLFIVGFVFFLYYSIKHLKDHKRWITLSEYKSKYGNGKNT